MHYIVLFLIVLFGSESFTIAQNVTATVLPVAPTPFQYCTEDGFLAGFQQSTLLGEDPGQFCSCWNSIPLETTTVAGPTSTMLISPSQDRVSPTDFQ